MYSVVGVKSFVPYLLSLLVVTTTVGQINEGMPSRCYDILPDSTIQNILLNVNDSTISSCIKRLEDFTTRYWSNANHDTIASWVYSNLLTAGIPDVRFDTVYYDNTLQRNVVATIPGIIHPEFVILVGGHLDSQSSNNDHAPGADDNASGATAVLEIARVLQAVQYQPNVTLQFVAFAAEEAGMRGSLDYAARSRASGLDIKIMMNFDMIGYRNQSQGDRDVNIVSYPGSEAFSDLFATLSSAYTSVTPVFTSSYRSASDSYSFFQNGYQTFFVIERDFNPFYHTPNDVFVNIDVPYTREIIQAGLATLLHLDKVPTSPCALRVRDQGNGTSLVVTMSGNSLVDLSCYKIYIGSSFGNYDTSILSSLPSYTIHGLSDGTKYHVGVSLVDHIGLESPIIERTAVPHLIPLSPQGVTMIQSTTATVLLSWHPNDELDIAGYNIYRKLASDRQFGFIHTVAHPETVWVDSVRSLDPCWYFLTAFDSTLHESTASDTVVYTPVTGVQVEGNPPNSFLLEQNYPNPFNPLTHIRFTLQAREYASLKIFDVLGREVAVLVNEVQDGGTKTLVWTPPSIAGGVYYYRLQTILGQSTKRMILSK